MVILDKSIHVKAPPERVWALLADAPAHPAWAPGVVRVAVAPTVGASSGRISVTIREDLGLELKSEQETVSVDPPRRLEWRQRDGDFTANEGCYELAPDDAGTTRVRLRVTVELPFVLPRLLTEHEIRAHYSRCFDDALVTLKRRAESDAHLL